jgi:glutaminyl-tRNA synthetase
MVRLKSAYIIRCENVVKDASGSIVEIQCTHVPESRSGSDTSGINVKGTIHWVSAPHAVTVETRLYDKGYFCLDVDSTKTKLVFNRTVTLRDLWAKGPAKP